MAQLKFFAELKRRNIYKAAAAYGVVSWSLIQVATQVFTFFDVPHWGGRIVVLLIIIGFPFAMLGAWTFELASEGIIRRHAGDRSVANRQRASRWLIAVTVVFAVIGLGLLVFTLFQHQSHPPQAAAAPAGKSIAVLPFASLSDDKANAYFAAGIQDEVLTHLAKIGGLKVISRTSTERYKSAPADLKEIARQLGVGAILEGSVQRSGDQPHPKVRVNVQLINAETDSHLWAEIYDRDLTDLFAVESEVAEKIANSLDVQLTGRERTAIAVQPTRDSAAYDSYLRGLAFESRAQTEETYEQIVRYFSEAVQIDPAFALAWAHLGTAHSFYYFNQWDHSPARLAVAKEATDKALALQPELGEGYLARGYFHYYCEHDYAAAAADFEAAQARMPNDSEVRLALAYLERRRGDWEKALAQFEQSARVDPRNVLLCYEWGSTQSKLRRFSEARAIFDRGLDVAPDDADLSAAKAATYQAEGNLEASEKLLAAIPPRAADSNSSTLKKLQDLYQHRYSALADRCRAELALPGELEGSTRGLVTFILGLAEARSGRQEEAQAAFADGRHYLASLPPDEQQDPNVAAYLALNCAALDDKDAALAAAARALQLSEHDAMLAPLMELNRAQVEALLGDADAAVRDLPALLRKPAAQITPALLRLDPLWAGIAADPRFQELASGKPGNG